VGDFAQALRAVGEPIFGRTARDVSMSRVLIQLFEITGQFDMHLRPELVLLQKTMMTAEGVARSIWPDLDIWTAADPVVRRWMTRELSPAARLTRLGEQAGRILSRLSALADPPPPCPPPRGPRAAVILAGSALSVALAALILAASAL
jgi:ubiquinone biosynthesis protein